MTIKEFAKLCGCNPQTLRYYDRVGLLKPVRVDRYSGYRFYDEKQAVTFVKIKNLQSALFTKEQLEVIRQKVTESMRAYDPSEQFDIDGEQYARITDNVCNFFESMLTASDADISYTPQEVGDKAREEEKYGDRAE